MVKKFKTLSENQLAQTVRESAQQIWLAGLGAYAKAQEEGSKVFDALVKEGETIQKKTRKAADEKIAVVDHQGRPARGIASSRFSRIASRAPCPASAYRARRTSTSCRSASPN